MELQQLKDFYTIAQCESLTKAAQKLHTSQPSLSRSLRSLEDELGTQLFDRVGRNIVLNDAGRFALERVFAVLKSAEAIKRDVDEFVYDKNLSVDIYSPVPMGDMEKVTFGFKRKYPEIRLRLAAWPGGKEISNLRPSITFFASPIVHKERNYLMLGEEEIMLAVSRNNPLAQEESVALSSLADADFVRVLPSALYEMTSHMFIEAGFRPNTIAEFQDYNHVLAYVACDFGITLAPSITWFSEYRQKQVVCIPLSDVHRKRYLYVKWPENTIMNWATLRFREYLVNYFNETYGFTCSLSGVNVPTDSAE